MESQLPSDRQILRIAAEVAETTDDNVPCILLDLKDVLNDHPVGSTKAAQVRLELWNYDLIHVTNLALKQDFTPIRGQLDTASKLCVILCTSCCGLIVPNQLEFQRQFLPSVVETMLFIFSQISEKLTVTSSDEGKEKLARNALDIVDAISNLLQYYKFLSVSVLSSKRFLQLLMTEDTKIAILVMNLIIIILKVDRNVFTDVQDSTMHTLVDEMVFKLSAASEAAVASTASRVLLFCIDTYPPLVDLLTSKRYKGLKAYLGKWKGKGFARDIMRLTAILEARSIQQVEQMKMSASAAKIQAAYKGYKTRQQLSKAAKAIAHFQHIYRERKRREKELAEQEELLKAQKEIEKAKRRREFLTSRSKQLKVVENVPARTVNLFLQDLQNHSATRIQASWRGFKSRKENKSVLTDLRKLKAAIKIQKQVRRWLRIKRERRRRIVNDLYPAGLDDERRVQLQKVITNVREQFQVQSRTHEEVEALHSQAYEMLSTYYRRLPASRRQDEHRHAVMAQIAVLTEQLMTAPRLKEATEEDIRKFSSRSTPVVLAAKQKHNETIQKMKRQWWEKLEEEEDALSGRQDVFSDDLWAVRGKQF